MLRCGSVQQAGGAPTVGRYLLFVGLIHSPTYTIIRLPPGCCSWLRCRGTAAHMQTRSAARWAQGRVHDGQWHFVSSWSAAAAFSAAPVVQFGCPLLQWKPPVSVFAALHLTTSSVCCPLAGAAGACRCWWRPRALPPPHARGLRVAARNEEGGDCLGLN